MRAFFTLQGRRRIYTAFFGIGVVFGAVIVMATVVPPLVKRAARTPTSSIAPAPMVSPREPRIPEPYVTDISEETNAKPTTDKLDGIVLVKKGIYREDEQIVAVRGIFGKLEKTLFTVESLRQVQNAATKRDFVDKGLGGAPRYGGACFSDVDVSPDRTKVIFGVSCEAGAAALPWNGVYDVASAKAVFLGLGAGERFVWTRDSGMVGYAIPIEGHGGETAALTVFSPTAKTIELEFSNRQDVAKINFMEWKKDVLIIWARVHNIDYLNQEEKKITYILTSSGKTQRINGWPEE